MTSMLFAKLEHKYYPLLILLVLVLSLLALPALAQSDEEEVEINPDIPAPIISSDVYKNPTSWYTPKPANISWFLPDNVERVAVEMGTSTSFEPKDVLDPAQSSYEILPSDLNEGKQYFGVQFEVDGDWGQIGYYPIKIDSKPPQNFYVDITTDTKSEVPKLLFNATDEQSGLAGYAIYVDGGDPLFLSPSEVKNGFSLKGVTSGNYRLKVEAYDKAGNSSVKTFPLVVLDESYAGVGGNGSEESREIAMMGLLALVLFGFYLMLEVYRQNKKREDRLKREMGEVNKQMEKIFTALRDEIFDQIRSITSKKRLSKKEEEVVGNLQNVVSVSETLINKEIRDVDKIINEGQSSSSNKKTGKKKRKK